MILWSCEALLIFTICYKLLCLHCITATTVTVVIVIAFFIIIIIVIVIVKFLQWLQLYQLPPPAMLFIFVLVEFTADVRRKLSFVYGPWL